MNSFYIDLIVSIFAISYGFYIFTVKMHSFSRKYYTPPLDSIIVLSGLLGWSIFGLSSFTVITKIPSWAANNDVGNYSYTSARIMLFIAWMVALEKYRRFDFAALQEGRNVKKTN